MAHQKINFTNIELSFFCEQLSMVLSSGISAFEGFTLMAEDSENEQERALFSEILSHLENGCSLYESLSNTGYFPAYLLQMVQIGEETGKVDEVFSSLALHYQREHSIRHSIRHALIYPLIMTAMMLLVVLILLTKVMPIFNQVFIQLGSEMTGLAGILVALGDRLSQSIFVVIAFFIVLVSMIYICRKRIVHYIPYTKTLYEKIAACHFASGMALTLGSGLNTIHALELVSQLNEDKDFEAKLLRCKEFFENGEDLSKALLHSRIFTGLYARMASIGEKSGTLEQSMQKIADSYQEDSNQQINQLLSVIEPTLVITLSLIVGVILLSVMFPLIGIMANL